MATEQLLPRATETAQSPATPQEDNLSTLYGALDKDAKEEQDKKDQRRLQNKLDIDRMKKELETLHENVTTDKGEELWKDAFQTFKDKHIVGRAFGLVENTARELYMGGRACENVKEATILAQPKLAEVVGALTPKAGAQSWYEVIKVTAQKVDDRIDALERLQEETKKRDRAAHATVLTTLMSLVVSYANGVNDQDTQAKMISNISPIILTLLLALKTIMESNHDKKMQNIKKKNLVDDYKRAMWAIACFADAGADRQGQGPDGGAEDPKDSKDAKDANKGEKKDGLDDGVAQETKEGPEEA